MSKMNQDPSELRELLSRRPLRPAEQAQLEAWLAMHPEARADWAADAALSALLARLPEQPAPSNLTARILAEIEREMLEMDSQADVHLEFDCPACSAKWSAVFDILAFLWGELDAWAQRLLLEVHSLASAYGWREADILEMSATRRSIYLNMVSG